MSNGKGAGAANVAGAGVAKRERFGSRLGFILISAGCAIGLGNVWRFPYITGEYGGAAFVLMYLVFLVILGLPVMVMEFAVGRASQKSSAAAFDTLQPSRKWHWFSWWGYIGCMVLMMFYTTVGGWMLSFVVKMGTGAFNGLDSAGVGAVFNDMLANPTELVGWMLVVIVLGFLVCSLGLQKGVERVTKVMMVCLLGIMAVLVVRAVTLPGGLEGLKFYLVPDFGKLFAGATSAEQWATFGDAVYAAMGQAFFTLSLGISAMEIFGSYIGKERSLTGEALRICGLDTAVALVAGLIIFPACFAFAVEPDSGPGLVFVTLPSVFNQMPMGQLWGALFFVFMSFAALSTIIAVFENLISWHGRYRDGAQPAVRPRVQRAGGRADSGHRRHPVHRGLHRVEQPAAAGQPVLRAVLRDEGRLGLGQLPGRGRHGHGRALPRLVASVAEIRHPGADPGHIRDGLRAEVRRVVGIRVTSCASACRS